MTASKERVENPRRTRTRAHAEVTNRIHFPLLCNPLQSLPGMTNTYNVNANLPHAPRIWMLFWQISALFFPVFSVSKQFFYVSPLSLEIRDSSYISKEKKKHTTRPITSDSSSSPSPLRQHSSAVLSSQVTCTPAFLCPRSHRRPTPRICFCMRVMTRGSAQLCSLGTGSVESRWRPDSSGDIL